MAKTLELLGYQVFRGSSSRGGARGLIGLIRAVKEGSQASLAVDGPKGPIFEVKPGIVQLAIKTGQPIVPVGTRAEHAWFVPKAWNRSYLPKPFSRIHVNYGEPIFISADQKDDKTLLNLCHTVKIALDQIEGKKSLPYTNSQQLQ